MSKIIFLTDCYSRIIDFSRYNASDINPYKVFYMIVL